jgi:Na+/melibiose symporter-like transporter
MDDAEGLKTPQEAAETTYPTAFDFRDDFRRASQLIAFGWLFSNIGNGMAHYPVTFLLKDELKMTASAVAAFTLFGSMASYTKPLLAILMDAYPLGGTRWRHYLLLAAISSSLLWLLLGFVPRTFEWLLATYILLYWCLNLMSASLGGVMVEVGQRNQATGQLSAQRVAITRIDTLVSQPIGAWLAKFPFTWAMFLSSGLYLALVPIFLRGTREPRTARVRRNVLEDARRQFYAITRSRTLFMAAGAVMLIMLAPGFGTPMLYYQTDTLNFPKEFLAVLAFLSGLFGLIGAALYALVCRRYSLRSLLAWSIVIDAIATLFYLFYRTRESALIITALEGIAQTLAILPLYDMAARATPKGSEALGYALMMSAWNLTAALSNWFGSYLYDARGMTFMQLVWLNAGTTALVLVIVPFLPASLLRRRDGDKAEPPEPSPV